MHEASIAANLLDIATDIAAQNDLRCIERVVVAVGDFTGVEIHALEFAFQVLVRATLAEGADLVVERIPILLQCQSCDAQYPAEMDDLTCPVCDSQNFEILQGRELMLRTIIGR